MKVEALVAAGGSGTRVERATLPKQFLKLIRRTVLLYVLETISESPLVDGIILVVPQDKLEYTRFLIQKFHIKKIKDIVTGGKSRTQSVYAGLQRVSADTDIVLIHDGVRPLLQQDALHRVIEAARLEGAAVLGVPVKPTIKQAGEQEFVSKTLDRSKLYEIQTPQVFRKDLIVEAYKKAVESGIEATDDAALVERLGHPVKIVHGSYTNIKITTDEDLLIAGALLKYESRKDKHET